jgi:hypothetical protein
VRATGKPKAPRWIMKERGLRDYFDALGSSPINYLYHAQYADKRITPLSPPRAVRTMAKLAPPSRRRPLWVHLSRRVSANHRSTLDGSRPV